MKIIKQSWEFVRKPDGADILRLIEEAGRTCYKSEDKITPESTNRRVRGWIESGHHSVIEHANISVRIITDRGVTHELVRHRLASYSQESTRYCNYSKNKFGNELTVILPVRFYSVYEDFVKTEEPVDASSEGMLEKHGNLWTRFCNWHNGLVDAQAYYLHDLELGGSPQEARDLLPNSLKTEIVMTANIREWRHVFSLRCSKKAHPQIRSLMLDMLLYFNKCVPVVFEDITKEAGVTL